MIRFGKVVDIYNDENGGERVKVTIQGIDEKRENVPDAFPLLPKLIHTKPKVGEAVFVFCLNDNPYDQRFYIGPIISQYQKLQEDPYYRSALKLIGGSGTIEPSVHNMPDTHGAFATDEDVAFYGRKNTDIILGENDVRIRCGARLMESLKSTKISLNKVNPAFIKLKYHENKLTVNKKIWNYDHFEYGSESKVESSMNIVGQEINLISTEGDPYIKVSNTDVENAQSVNKGNEGISDTDLAKFISNAHPLPYGDKLIEFLHLFFVAFQKHTHKYDNMEPVFEDTMSAAYMYDLNKILSKNIRIN